LSISSPARKHLAIGDRFQVLVAQTARCLGSPWSFVIAVLAVVVWVITGPLFHFSNAWPLVINTATTIVTFLMVFLIQSTQNRDAKAIHLKLDELIRSSKARDVFADLEDATEAELDAFKQEFRKLRESRVTPSEAAEVAHSRVHKPGSH
jgi:low affinity Fe/Cu permease